MGKRKSSALHLYHHTHWDREWYDPFRVYQLRLAPVVDALLARLESGALKCFTLDGQTSVLADYLELRPENRARLATLIQAGRLRVGPWFVMPDEFLVSGESLVRNLQRGIAEARAWGCDTFTGYLPDTFGHSAEMPMILKHVGIDTAMLWRGVAPGDSPLFSWQSADGSTVFTYHLQQGYFQNALHDPALSTQEKAAGVQAFVEKLSPPVLLPIGGDHLGPLDAAGLAQLQSLFPKALQTTAPDFMHDLINKETLSALPTRTGELREGGVPGAPYLLPGIGSARLYLKQANRRLEHQLVKQAEPLVAMAQCLLETPPLAPTHELEKAWELLLLNHPHDSIGGCSVDAVHRENESRFEQAAQLATGLIQNQHAALGHAMATPQDWVLVNLGDRPYTGVVPVTAWETPENPTPPEGMQIDTTETVLKDDFRYNILDIPLADRRRTRWTGWLWAEKIPSHGLRVLSKHCACQLDNKRPYTPVAVTSRALENDRLQVVIAADGTLTVTDKTTGKTFTGLHRILDWPDHGDSYNVGPVTGSQPEAATLLGVTPGHSGPLVGSLTLQYCLGERTLETEVLLQAGSNRLTFETRFTNTRADHWLQVGFETGAPVECVLAESHFGTVERRYDPTLDARKPGVLPVSTGLEFLPNTGPIQRSAMANAQLFLTEGLSEYEVRGETLWLTLLRSFDMLSKDDTGTRGGHAGPPLATPEGQCLGRTLVCRYAWQPAPEQRSDAAHAADAFYGVVWGEQGRGATPQGYKPGALNQTRSLVHWENAHVVSTSLCWEPVRESALLRLLNLSDMPQTVTLQSDAPYKTLQPVNFLGEPLPDASTLVFGMGVTIPPAGVMTLRLS